MYMILVKWKAHRHRGSRKKLNLSRKSEINAINAFGIRDQDGIYNKRFRIPFDNVYSYI